MPATKYIILGLDDDYCIVHSCKILKWVIVIESKV